MRGLTRLFTQARVKPWMQDREIRIVEEIIRRLRPMRCLEWGAGHSTGYFTADLPRGSRWLSVEHDADWYREVNRQLERRPSDKVTVVHVPPNRFPWSDSDGDGTYADLADYVDYPSGFGPFEFILIDGRARRDCLVKAHSLLTDRGVVVLHDAGRPYYHPPFELYESHILLRDPRQDEQGVWIGSRQLEWPDHLAEIEKLWMQQEQ